MVSGLPHDEILTSYDRLRHDLKIFMKGVVSYVGDHPDLTQGGRGIVHSYKSASKIVSTSEKKFHVKSRTVGRSMSIISRGRSQILRAFGSCIFFRKIFLQSTP